ncbi:MAG TPA: hypothetical protein VGR71_03120 [Nitrospira sp.]|nr:hypothetical protein [Nitrospira sp.]
MDPETPKAPVDAQAPAAPEAPKISLTGDDLRTILAEAIKQATEPLKAQVDQLQSDLQRAQSIQAFEQANAQGQAQSGVYRGRPDSARHVTIATRPVREAPELYDRPVGGVPAIPKEIDDGTA